MSIGGQVCAFVLIAVVCGLYVSGVRVDELGRPLWLRRRYERRDR